ncbi:MAG TPA: thiamine pyrophosphate-dependent enzyme [Terracidiphilus sp.]|nr:thiamine pyrophosphate-dependent enzyme [Terracidiphilus sp.]
MKIKGNPRASTPAPHSVHNGFSLVSNEKLAQLFAAMLKCRMIEERMVPSRKASAPRREAVAAAVAIDLHPDDAVAVSPRDLPACFIKGLPLGSLFPAPAPSPQSPRGGRSDPFTVSNILPPSLSASARVNLAAGLALANSHSSHERIVVVFLDDLQNIDACRETLDFAASHLLPMLFVSLHVPHNPAGRKRTVPASRSKPSPASIPTIAVDRNDAVAVYRVAQEAIGHARRGSGPTLIHCLPFRIEGAPSGKPADDPITNMERYLARKGLPVAQLKDSVLAGFASELRAAIEAEAHPARSRRAKV